MKGTEVPCYYYTIRLALSLLGGLRRAYLDYVHDVISCTSASSPTTRPAAVLC